MYLHALLVVSRHRTDPWGWFLLPVSPSYKTWQVLQGHLFLQPLGDEHQPTTNNEKTYKNHNTDYQPTNFIILRNQTTCKNDNMKKHLINTALHSLTIYKLSSLTNPFDKQVQINVPCSLYLLEFFFLLLRRIMLVILAPWWDSTSSHRLLKLRKLKRTSS